MKRILFALIVAVILLPSCATPRYFGGFKTSDAIGDMALLGPASCQFFVDYNNNEHYSDSLSAVSQAMLTDITLQMVPINEVMPLDSLQKEEAVAFMRFIFDQPKAVMENAAIPSALDDMLETAGIRYGLLIYADGMTRDKKAYLRDSAIGLALGIATAILTLGMVSVYGYSIPYVSGMDAAVLDSQTDRVVYYSHFPADERNPLSENQVRTQLARVLRDFR